MSEYVQKSEFKQYQEAMSVQLKLFRDEYLKTVDELKELKKKIEKTEKTEKTNGPYGLPLSIEVIQHMRNFRVEGE